MSTAVLLTCQACGRPSLPLDAPSCPGCQALHYCTTKHLQLHRQHAHGPEECQRMAEQLQRGPLLQPDMPWPVQSMQELEAWLRSACAATPHSVPQGLAWRSWQLHSPNQQHPPQLYSLPATQAEWRQAWGLADPACVPAWPSVTNQHQQQHPASSWRLYYEQRGLPDTSPAALVLHFVLTLWHCLVSVLPAAGWALPPKGQHITVAYLGPRGELDLLPAFAELALLLPDHHLHIHFIGPDVPEQLHAQSCRLVLDPHNDSSHSTSQQQQQQQSPDGHTGGSLQVSCWSSCFHDALEDWRRHDHTAGTWEQQEDHQQQQQQLGEGWFPAVAPPPADRFHLVFAANAGLPAFASWLPTLQQLVQLAPAAKTQQERHGQQIDASSAGVQSNAQSAASGSASSQQGGVPVVFTDYCEEAVHMSAQLAEHVLGQPFSLGCCLNPFRDPVPTNSHGTRLPACSNGFLFGWL